MPSVSEQEPQTASGTVQRLGYMFVSEKNFPIDSFFWRNPAHEIRHNEWAL